MRHFNRFNTAVSNILLVLAGALLTAMMVLACANMVLRFFDRPVLGTYELMGFMGALVTALALAGTQLKGGHIALTVMAGMLPKPLERAIDAISSLACAAFFALAAWRTTIWGTTLIDTGELSETLRIPYHPFVFITALGCAMLALTLLADGLASILPKPARKDAL